MLYMIEDLKFALFLAFKTIQRGNRGTIVLTILIMTLAFINLIFITSLMHGITTTIDKQSTDNLYGNIVIEPAEDEKYIKNVDQIISQVSDVPGVIGCSAHYIDNVLVTNDKNNDGKDIKSGGWAVKSINVEDETNITSIHNVVQAGEYLEKGDRQKVIIGKDVAGAYDSPLEFISLKADVHDKVKVRFSNGTIREYDVKGIYNTKSLFADSFLFITEKEFESIYGVRGMASEIIVKLEKNGLEQAYIKKFRELGIVKEEMKVWDELLGISADLNKSFKMINFILSSIGTIVAGVAIFIVIYVSVVNKRKHIGILKAIGMNESIIINSFILQAIFYSVMGIGIGLLVVFTLIEPYFIKHPLDFPLGWVSLHIDIMTIFRSGLSLLIASFVGSFFPAGKGARETILKAIWG